MSRRPPTPRHAVVLDNEAVQLLLPSRRHDRRRRTVLAALEEAVAVRTPTPARVEAAAARSAANATLNRLTRDAALDSAAADRAVALVEALEGDRSPSTVDASVAVEAERLARSGRFSRVEVLTSDARDLLGLAAVAGTAFSVVVV